MSATLLWNNLVAYSVQVLALVAVGAVLPLLLRIHQPRMQLLYLRLLLGASLLLPMLQPWRRPVVTLTPPAAIATLTGAPVAGPSPAKPQIRWEETALAVVGVGVVLLILWLLVGMWRLRRLRTGAAPLDPLPEVIEAARLRSGAKAVVCVSEDIAGPVTFGARRPVILLPPALLEQPYEAQFGIACHEFLHVRRHDWLYTVWEEFAGALVWFNPAVWWLLGQIHLAREQVVDREVVSLTEARDPYVHALLAMGGARPQLDLAPATLFLRKRHLSNRIHALLKEVTMSRGRLISCYALTAAALLATAWFAVVSFPLEASPRVEVQQGAASQGVVHIEVVSTLPEPLRSSMRARLATFEGQPYTLDSRGAILKAAREIDPAARFATVIQTESANGSLVTIFPVTVGQTPPTPQGPVHIDVSGLPEPLRSTTEARLAPFDGQLYTPDLRNLVTKALTEVDPKARWVLAVPRQTADGSVTLTVALAFGDRGAMPTGFPPSSGSSLLWYFPRGGGPPPAPADFPPSSAQRIQVDGAEQQKKLVSLARPQYPPLAREARIQGMVRFNALIGVEGRVANLALVSGHPLLVPAAEEVVRQWVYQPTLLNGEPVEVVTQIDVNFTLL